MLMLGYVFYITICGRCRRLLPPGGFAPIGLRRREATGREEPPATTTKKILEHKNLNNAGCTEVAFCVINNFQFPCHLLTTAFLH